MKIKKPLIILSLISSFALANAANAEYESDDLTRFINEGITYHNNRNYIQAIKSFTRALSYSPGNKDILANLSITHNNYGKYLVERTDDDGAAREFRNALYYDINNNVSRINLDTKLEELGEDPKDIDTRLKLAQKERKRANFFAAIAEARESIRLKENLEAYLEIGEIYHVLYLKTGRKLEYANKAIDSLTMAQQIAGDDIRPIVKLGDLYVAKNEISKGIDFYKDAIAKEPDSRIAQSALVNGWLAAVRMAPNIASNHTGLATAYQLQGNFTQAERGFRRALEISPDNRLALEGLKTLRVDRVKTQSSLFINRALDLQKAEKYDAALAEYIKALNLEPNNADIHYNIGTAFQAKNDFIRAEKAYRRTLDLRPRDNLAQDALDNLLSKKANVAVEKGFQHAIRLQEMGKLEDAIKVYNAIAADRPEDDQVYFNLGTAYQATGNIDKALDNYEFAYELDQKPEYKDAITTVKLEKANGLLSKGIDLQSAGNNEEAILSYESVIVLFPDNSSAWYNLGTAFQALDKKEEALNAYKKAFALDEKNQSDAIFFAAILLEEKRELIAAIDLYEKYLAVDPAGTYSKESKERQEYIKSFL